MIYSGSYLNVLDNSGASKVKCIHVYKKKYASIGDLILVVIKETKDSKKVNKSQMFCAVVAQTKFGLRRTFGHRFCYKDNFVILLKNKDSLAPVGTRIKGILPLDLKRKGHARLIALAWASI